MKRIVRQQILRSATLFCFNQILLEQAVITRDEYLKITQLIRASDPLSAPTA